MIEFPYFNMQQLNLDWIIDKIKGMLSFLPDDGTAGQILRRTADGAEWSDETGDSVESVNGKTGVVVLDANDILMDDNSSVEDSVNDIKNAFIHDAATWTDATPVETLSDTYIAQNGVISPATYWRTRLYAISEGNIIKTSARAYSNRYYYAFYDSSDNFISGLLRTESGSGNMVEAVLTAPPQSSYIAIVDFPTVYETQPQIPDSYSVVPFLKKWAGKKWVAFGDSLTEMNQRTTKHYYDYVSDVTGISVHVMGNSGSGYMEEQDLGTAFYQRISGVPTDADVITIFGSFNDMSLFANLGTDTDSGTTTIGGCINTTLDNLFTAYPLANVGLVTPSPWVNSNPTTEPNNASQYVDLIIAIAKRRGIPCLDLFHCSALRPWDSDFRDLAYSKDGGNGVHPDETGHKILAPHFQAFLDSLLLH